jgi:type IV secretory pathway ATPase VirB11/archaellum biosynthesis ATPase
MFYLSKRLRQLVNTISGIKSSRSEEPEGSKLGFKIDSYDCGAVIDQSLSVVPRAIAKTGSEYAYIIANGFSALTKREMMLAESAKRSVISLLSESEEEISIGLLSKAKEIAGIELGKSLGNERASYLSYLVAHDTVGYGPISILMEDKKQIEEIEINAPCAPINIFHVSYGRCRTNLSFNNSESFRHTLNKFIYETDKELGEDTPIIDAQVEDARIHAQIKPYALSGAVASIRLIDNKVVGVDYIKRKGTSDFEVLAYLWLAMDACRNILIAGSPASGKTTLMSALFSFISRAERMVTIEEDINELKVKLDINNTVALYGSRYGRSTSIREQVINALRMRPDRLVVGEVRGEETRELFSGANMGIPFMTTMHSNSGGLDIIKKLIIKPMGVETKSLSMLDLAVYMRHLDLSRRVLSDIYEYKWLSRAETERLGVEIDEADSVEILDIVRDSKLDKSLLMQSKIIDGFAKKSDITKKAAINELVKRAEFLKVICEGCKNTNEITEKIQGYGL